LLKRYECCSSTFALNELVGFEDSYDSLHLSRLPLFLI
jgi:hypothetical protein